MFHAGLVCLLLEAACAIVANHSVALPDHAKRLPRQRRSVQLLSGSAGLRQKSCASAVAPDFSPAGAASATASKSKVALTGCAGAQCVTSHAVIRGLASGDKWIVQQPLCVPTNCIDNASLVQIGDALFERDLKAVFFNDSYFEVPGAALPGPREDYDGALVVIVIDCSSESGGAKVEVANHVSFFLHALEMQTARNLRVMKYSFLLIVLSVIALGLLVLYLRHREMSQSQVRAEENRARSRSIRERALSAASRGCAARAA